MFGSEPRPSDPERMFWSNLRETVPEGLEGQVLDSLDELKAKLPKDDASKVFVMKEHKGGVFLKGYTVYGLSHFNPVAYECHACQKIIVDKPRIEDEQSISYEHPLSGREGYDVYCGNCNGHLGEHTSMRS